MNAFPNTKTIAVCGAGTMGAGIAQVCAAAGFHTLLYDTRAEGLESGMAQIARNLQTGVDKGKLSAENAAAIRLRVQAICNVSDCVADVVIEAIVEKIPAKVQLFTQLAAVNSPQTIFASNTSSLSISDIAAQVPYPGRVAGLHFFNPAHLMQLVEVVKGIHTSTEVFEWLCQFVLQLKKVPVRVKDAPGFIVNRVARHYYLEAMQVAEEGVADIAAIDRLLEAAGFKMGPFALMDLIGNDVNLAVTQSLYSAFAQAPRFRPGKMQADKVEMNHLGRKTGKGFYNY